MAPAAARGHVADPAAEVDEPDPVAGAQRSARRSPPRPARRCRGCSPRRRRPRCADVVLGVEQQQHLGVAVRPRRRDVQRAGARRHRPVDPPQPVARAERPHLGRLAARALAVRAVQPDQSGRPGHRSTACEVGAEGQRRHARPGRADAARSGRRRAATCTTAVRSVDLVAAPAHGPQRERDVDDRACARPRPARRRRDRCAATVRSPSDDGDDVAGRSAVVRPRRSHRRASSTGPRTACARRRRACGDAAAAGGAARPSAAAARNGTPSTARSTRRRPARRRPGSRRRATTARRWACVGRHVAGARSPASPSAGRTVGGAGTDDEHVARRPTRRRRRAATARDAR